VLTEVTLPYNGLTLDRAGSRRTDPGWVAATRETGSALALWRDGCLVKDGRPVLVRPAAALHEVGADEVVDVRRLFAAVPAPEAAILAYAKGMPHWNRNQRFCGACGGPTTPRDAGHLRVATGAESCCSLGSSRR
jgi:NAD+ diphosphatase